MKKVISIFLLLCSILLSQETSNVLVLPDSVGTQVVEADSTSKLVLDSLVISDVPDNNNQEDWISKETEKILVFSFISFILGVIAGGN